MKFKLKGGPRSNWLAAGFLALAIALLFNFSFCLNGIKAETDDEEREEEIEEIKDEIKEVEKEISEETEKKTEIQSELNVINENVRKTQLEINETNRKLDRFEAEISDKEKNISQIEQEIEKSKSFLAEYLRAYRQSTDEIGLVVLDSDQDIGDYLRLLENYQSIQDEIEDAMNEIRQEKNKLVEEKNVVEEKKDEQYQTYLLQKDQQNTLQAEQSRQNYYLNKSQAEIDDLSLKKEDLRRQLDSLQSLGTPISLEKAIKVAKKVEKITDVRAEFLLGVLRVESNMGQNVGGGRYKPDMHPDQRDIFKDICKELGLNYKEMPVSKRVCYNPKAKDGCGGWGGAMGPAQFMPSTWIGYKDRVGKLTGNDPPNPWDLEDAMTAMGLKLAAVPGVTSHKRSAELKAASMYLAGGNWEAYTWYGERVLYYADAFKKYIDD